LKTPLSYSVAPGDAQRPRVLSGGVLAGIVVLALGGLALVFPRTDLMTLLRGQSSLGNSDLTVAYLRNLIRTEPADQGLQLLLAEKLLAAGDLKGAREALDQAKPLAPVAADGQRAWQALDRTWWEARLRQAQMRDNDADVVEAAAALLARLQARLPAIARPAELFAAMASVQALKSGLQDIEGRWCCAG
jgi:tetratricopeptide (TPR) repeat protein